MDSAARIVPLTQEIATKVALDLRERDKKEVLAAAPCALTEFEALSWWVQHILAADGWAAMIDEVPVAMGGIRGIEGRPDQATSWAVGTDRKLEAGAAIFYRAYRLHEEWQRRGVRRFSCLCLHTYPEESSDWLVRLGYQCEGLLRSLGRNGEDFRVWSRIHG